LGERCQRRPSTRGGPRGPTTFVWVPEGKKKDEKWESL